MQFPEEMKKDPQISLQVVLVTAIPAIGILTGFHLIALAIPIPLALLLIGIRHIQGPEGPRKTVLYAWNQPALRTLGIAIIISTGTSMLYVGHMYQMDGELIPPSEGKPWTQDLTARVYWSKQPSQEIQNGFADTIKLLGFNHRTVDSTQEANIRVQLDSWDRLCKWPTIKGFAILDPNPGPKGGRTGEIHICRFSTPLIIPPGMTDRGLIAHETAHIFAAQEHTDSGLMKQGGGDGFSWFNQDEIREMCDRIDQFHQSVRAEDNRPGAQESKCG